MSYALMDTAVKAFVFIELGTIGETDKQVNNQINVTLQIMLGDIKDSSRKYIECRMDRGLSEKVMLNFDFTDEKDLDIQ